MSINSINTNKKVGVADFETTLTEPVKVWLAGVKDLTDDNRDTQNNSFRYFDNFKDWFYYCLEEYKEILFHNAKFDTSFIINELNKIGFKYYDINKKIRGKRRKIPKGKCTYTCDMDLMGQLYEVKITDNFGNRLTIHDSLKLFQCSVKDLGKSLNYDKLQINEQNDYSDYTISKQAVEYLHRDIDIPRIMIKELRAQGYTKKTIASCSLHSYKKIIGKNTFNEWFPNAVTRKDTHEILHKYCNQSYDGGESLTYMNLEHECKYGLVMDVNSLYPAMCLQRPLPYGNPIDDNGEDIKTPEEYIQYNDWEPQENTLSIMEVIIDYAHIKKEYIPCIRSKECNVNGFTTGIFNCSNELNPEEKWLSTISNYHAIITEIDYRQLLKAYEKVKVKIISYIRFKAQTGMFDKYFSYWGERKKQHGKEGNKVLRQIDKMFMNSLTGKFGTNVDANYKIPYFDEGVLKYTNNTVVYDNIETKASVYVPVIAFITAYGREYLIDSIHKLGVDNFLYCDTDSIHLKANKELTKIIKKMLTTEDDTQLLTYLQNKDIWVDYNDLGAWAVESVISRGKYIRAKTYIEQVVAYPDKKKYNTCDIDVKSCGMTEHIKKYCTFDNFKRNTCWCIAKDKEKYIKKGFEVVEVLEQDAKLMPTQVKGGCLLVPTGFSINRINICK